MPRTFAIGDVHGCSLALRNLLATIRPDADDTVVMLGDYVDRGPDSQGVIETLLEWRTNCRLITLKGNHECMMQNALLSPSESRFWMQFGGKQTIASYGRSPQDVPEEHWRFLEECLPYFEIDDYFFVHANYEPRIGLESQTDEYRYWLHVKSPPLPHVSGKRAIVGHTSQKSGEILHYENLICIDTFCHGGGWLTALEVDSHQYWQVNRSGKVRLPTPQTLAPLF